MNKQYIYNGIQDMPCTHIKNEIQYLMVHDFEFGVPRNKWHIFKPTIYDYSDAQNRADDLDRTFITEFKLGRMYVDPNIEPLLITPVFCKDETDKVRLIYDYSYKFDGVNSLNALISEHLKPVEYPSLMQLIDFSDNDGQNNYMGKNDGKSFFRQIELAQTQRPLAVYYWRGYKIVDARMPCMFTK